VFTPSSVLPYIIGKKGANLKNIQESTGVNIKVPKREDMETTSIVADDESEEDLVEITIEGIDAAVSKAKEEINKIIDEKVLPRIDSID
jgi:predicted PilT family ATPase